MPDQLAQAFECFQRGDFATAKKLCQAMVKANPSAAEAWHLYGVVEHQLGNNQQGVEHVRKAIKLKPDDPQYHYNLGVLSNELGNTEDTIAAYLETLRLNPNHPAAANNLGNCYRGQGAFGQALETYEVAVSMQFGYFLSASA